MRLGLAPDKRYILVAGGSMGGGGIKKVIQMLADEIIRYKNTELIVLCGSNQQMYNELNETALSHVKVMGFASDMAGYLKAADLFITKPGGLSSTEAAVCGTPIIHIAPILGCETYNARFFSDHGMSAFCHTARRELGGALERLNNEAARGEMVRTQKRLIPPDASAQIIALAERMAVSC